MLGKPVHWIKMRSVWETRPDLLQTLGKNLFIKRMSGKKTFNAAECYK